MSFGNLGSFAGGAVQGYQAQQKLNQSQQQLDDDNDIRQRQMAVTEQTAKNQQDAVDRQNAMRTQSAALMQSSYGSQQVQDGEQVIDDGDGRSKTLPIMRTKDIQPGDDPAHDQKVYMGLAQIAAQNTSLSFEDMGKIAAQVDAVRRTDAGKHIDALLSGDNSALPDVAKLAGKDPAGAKVVADPMDNVFRIVYPDGTSSDLSRLAHAVATADTWKGMQEDSNGAQGAAKTKAAVAASASESNLRNVDAKAITTKLSGEVALTGAHTRALDASAARSKALTGALGDEKVGKELVAQAKLVAGRDPMSPDGKGQDPAQLAYLQGRGSSLIDGGATNPRQAVASANKEWSKVSAAASSWVDGLTMSKDELKAKFGTSDKAQIRALARDTALSKYETAIAPARTSNLATDDSED